MTTVFPQTIQNIDPNADWAANQLEWLSSTSTHEIYVMSNHNNNIKYTIKVGTDVNASDYNVWTDNGIDHPFDPVQNNSDGTVLLSSTSFGHPVLFKFYAPTTASWISTGGTGGGGTSTEGVNNVTVQWDPNPVCGQQTWVSVSHSEFLSTDTTYSINNSTGQIGTVTVAANTNTTAHAFWFTVTSGLVTVNGSNGDLYGMKVFNCDSSSRKKVFCNFW